MLSHRSNRVESLESRRLLSGAVVHHGVLDVTGSPGFANTISVQYHDSTKAEIDVAISFTNRKGAVTNFTKSFVTATAGITSVFVRGGNAADTIGIGQNATGFDLPTRVDALAGADTVTGADESTVVNAGNGADSVTLGNGNDTVRGAAGADVITVGNGTDKVDGGLGNDDIVTGTGSDTVNGGFGNDIITTHDLAGAAVLVHAGFGADSVATGDGNDAIWGDAGNDTIVSGNGNDTFGCISGSNTVTGGTGHNTYYGRKSQAFFENHNTTNYDNTKDTLIIKPVEAATPVV